MERLNVQEVCLAPGTAQVSLEESLVLEINLSKSQSTGALILMEVSVGKVTRNCEAYPTTNEHEWIRYYVE
jgi:hypothetical protein